MSVDGSADVTPYSIPDKQLRRRERQRETRPRTRRRRLAALSRRNCNHDVARPRAERDAQAHFPAAANRRRSSTCRTPRGTSARAPAPANSVSSNVRRRFSEYASPMCLFGRSDVVDGSLRLDLAELGPGSKAVAASGVAGRANHEPRVSRPALLFAEIHRGYGVAIRAGLACVADDAVIR